MRRILMIAALLLFAVPALAVDVEITATLGSQYTDGNNVEHKTVTIGYQNAAVDIRAFALELSVDSGMNIGDYPLGNFKTGESKVPAQGGTLGYGIFPGRFRDFVNPSNPDPCWASANYNPSTPWADAENTGLGWPSIIVELGTLYKEDGNKPGTSGTLFSFDVNSEGNAGGVLTIDVEALRGGVVKADGAAATTNLPLTVNLTITQGCTVPNVVDVAEATATAAITAAGFTLGVRTTACSATIVAGNIISTNPAGGTVDPTCGAVDYVVSLGGAPAVPASITYPATHTTGRYTISWPTVSGATGYIVERQLNGGAWTQVWTGAGLSCLADATAGSNIYRCAATNSCGTSAWRTGTASTTTYCYGSAVAGYAQWLADGRPQGWCDYPRQCHGDADGKSQGKSPNIYWVSTNDLAILKLAWNKTSAQVAVAPDPNGNANFDRKTQGKSPNIYSVSTNDLTVLKAYWNTTTVPADCVH